MSCKDIKRQGNVHAVHNLIIRFSVSMSVRECVMVVGFHKPYVQYVALLTEKR